jgi:SulP family sulfate permease
MQPPAHWPIESRLLLAGRLSPEKGPAEMPATHRFSLSPLAVRFEILYGLRSTARASMCDRAAVERNGKVRQVAVVILAGIVCGVVSTILSIGAASLVVASHLSSYFPSLIGIALFSASVLTLTLSLVGPMRTTVATVQPIPSVALGAIVGATTAGMSATDGNVFFTAMTAAALGTFASGVGMVLLGVYRLGEVARFVPYPVIAGFLAGTGWLILLGGLGIVLAVPASFGIFTRIPDAAALVRLGFAGAFVLVMVLAGRRYRSPLVLPSVIVVAMAIFNLARVLAGATESDIHAGDWVIAFPENNALWHGFNLAVLGEVYWPAVGLGLLYAPTLLVLTTLGLLLNTTAIELARNADIDLSRDLRSEGIGNAVSGLLGGLSGFKAVGPSLLATRLGVDSRWVGVVAAATILTVLLFGTRLLDVFPTVVLGGLLIWVGGNFLIQWLFVETRRINPWDIAIVSLIFVTIVAFGFGVGIVAGLIAAALLFIYQYSQVDVVRRELTDDDYRSSIVSTRRQNSSSGDDGSILIVLLHGFLFFGTANRLRYRMQERMRELGAKGHGYVVIDFRRVTGIDSSASVSFHRLRQAAAQSNVTIVLTGLDATARLALLASEREYGEAGAIHLEPDLERGVRWCKEALLAESDGGEEGTEHWPLAATLAEMVQDREAAELIGRRCERATVAPGAKLIVQGTPSEDVLFIESGHASVEVASGGEPPVHIASVGPGDILGEIAFYLGEERSASVIAEDEMIVWRLSREAMAELQRDAPAAALQFHRAMAAILSRRLVRTSRHVSILAS